MKIFLSWSGEISKGFAIALKSWIINYFDYKIDFFLSEEISAGKLWYDAIEENLNNCELGIFCITQGNLKSPWLGFEAGWLSKRFHDGTAIPLLLNVNPDDYNQSPLSGFQSKSTDLKGILYVLEKINSLAEKKIKDTVLKNNVENNFNVLNKELKSIVKYGSQGVIADYINLLNETNLERYYDEIIKIISYANKSIEILNPYRLDDVAENDKFFKKYSDTLLSHLAGNANIHFREVFANDIMINQQNIKNKTIGTHFKKLSDLRKSRMNVNFRLSEIYIENLLLVIDRQFLLISRSFWLPNDGGDNAGNNKLFGLISLSDSSEEIPQNLIDEFSIYWDRYSRDLGQVEIENLISKNGK